MTVDKDKKMLEISGLTVVYRTDDEVIHAVNSLDLDISHGESLGLVGEARCREDNDSIVHPAACGRSARRNYKRKDPI